MQPRSIQRANCANNPNNITLSCLALPGKESVAEVEVIYEEGTMHSDLATSKTVQTILQLLGLNEDPNHAGCQPFYFTIHTRQLENLEGVDFSQLNVTLAGKLGMIVAWYFDGEMCGDGEDAVIASGLIRDVIPRVVQDKMKRIASSDLFLLLDALGSFPFRDEEVEECYQRIGAAYRNTTYHRRPNP